MNLLLSSFPGLLWLIKVLNTFRCLSFVDNKNRKYTWKGVAAGQQLQVS